MNGTALATMSIGALSVIGSFVLALVTLRTSAAERRRQDEVQLAMSALPRRLEAFEAAWAALFRFEQKLQITDDMLNGLVEHSLWLPDNVRDAVLLAVTGSSSGKSIADLRRLLVRSSGSADMESVISHRMEVMNDDS
jgi:hypothetical protein